MLNRILIGIILVFASFSSALAVDGTMEIFLPAPACAENWTMDGKVSLFDKDSLFDRINGESELYFPYGFELLAYARYENKQNPRVAIDADIYKMGSLLDAFGMFANYRKQKDADVDIGGQGTISSSQVFLYQDRYFVRLQVTGATSVPQDVLLACAKTISHKLPQDRAKPRELEVLQVPAIVKKSERYIAQSLLGYDFFRKGMIADAMLNNEQVQLVLVIEGSGEDARKAMETYQAYLKASGAGVRTAGASGRNAFEATDPLYGTVLIEQAGRYIIGVVRSKNVPAAWQLIDQVRARVEKTVK